MQIIQTIGILRDSRLSSLLKEVVAEPLHEEVEDYVELGHAALVGEGVQHAELIFAHWLVRTSSLSSLLSGATVQMDSVVGSESGLKAAPFTLVELGLFLGSLFWTYLRCKDRLVLLPLVSIQLLLSMELLATAHNIAEDLSVRLHVPFEVGRPLGCEVTTFMLTFLDLVFYSFTFSDVGSSVVNHKMFFTFGTLELLVTPLVVVEGPGSLDGHSTLLAGVLLGVQVGLLLVLGELLVTIALLGAQIAH